MYIYTIFMYNYTFVTVPPWRVFHPRTVLTSIKENSRPRGRPLSFLGDMPNNEQRLDEYDESHAPVAAEQYLARFRVDNVDDGGVGYESVIDCFCVFDVPVAVLESNQDVVAFLSHSSSSSFVSLLY